MGSSPTFPAIKNKGVKIINSGINVLSLFDGIGMAHQALKDAKINIKSYYSSEIEKDSIKVALTNHPKQIFLGDVNNIKYFNQELIVKKKSPIKVDGIIDLLIGGSPCTNLSFAGKQDGLKTKCNQEILTLAQYLEFKNNEFEFEGQSFLFWEYIRLLKETKPRYFFLENVVMEEKWEKIFTDNLGVKPIKINSRIFTPQNRPRLYWTNIPYDANSLPNNDNRFKLIKQKSINRSDYYSDKALNWLVNHSHRIYEKTGKLKKLKIYNDETVVNAITASHCKKYSSQRFFAILDDGINNTIQKNKIKELYDECKKINDFSKLEVLTNWEDVLYGNMAYRYLTVEECELAQGLTFGYTKDISNTARYKSVGNGFTVPVISWFLKNIYL